MARVKSRLNVQFIDLPQFQSSIMEANDKIVYLFLILPFRYNFGTAWFGNSHQRVRRKKGNQGKHSNEYCLICARSECLCHLPCFALFGICFFAKPLNVECNTFENEIPPLNASILLQCIRRRRRHCCCCRGIVVVVIPK